MRGFLRAVTLLMTGWLMIGLAACGGNDSSGGSVVRVDVTPATATIAKGDTVQLRATAVYDDGTSQDVTGQALWSSSNTLTATVGDAGASKGLVLGQQQSNAPVVISAQFNQVLGNATVTVGASAPQRLDVTPATQSLPKGETRQLQARVVYSDGSTQDVTAQATWTSGAPAVASVNNTTGSKGIVTGLAQRDAPVSIIATLGQLSNSASVTVLAPNPVRLDVTPGSQAIPNGTTAQLTATATYSDNSTQNVTAQAVWQSAAPGLVSVDNGANKGRVTGNQIVANPVTITATFANINATAQVTVSNAILQQVQVTPANAQVPAGFTQQFTATAVFSDSSTQDATATATWSTANNAVATISNADGSQGLLNAVVANATPVAVSAVVGGITGTTNVTVTAAVVESIAVTPASVSVPRFGFKTQFRATGTFSNGSTADITNQVNWTSSANDNVATISNAAGARGLVTTGNTTGTSDIRAALGAVQSNIAQLTVTNATLQSIEIDATNKPFAPATTVSTGLGRSLDFVATGTFVTRTGLFSTSTSRQDITQSVAWIACDTPPASAGACEQTVATVSNAVATKGRVVTQSTGDSAITATITVDGSQVSRTATLSVTAAELVSLQVTAPTATLAGGFRAAYTATGRYTDGSVDDVTDEVTWVTNDSSVITISNAAADKGVATGGGVGSTTIQARQPSSVIASDLVPITVTNATLASIQVAPASVTIKQGEDRQLTATGSFSDGSTLNISEFNGVQWASANSSVVQVTPNDGEIFGLVQGGAVAISARRGTSGPAGVSQVTVSGIALVDLLIVPQSEEGCDAVVTGVESLPKGYARRFLACALFYNGTITDVTAQAVWATEAAGVVTVGNSGATKGRAEVVGDAGEQGTIRASYTTDGSTRAGTYTVSVFEGTVSSVTISSDVSVADPLAPQTVVPFTAVANFSGGQMGVNITESVTWSSSEAAVATVSNTNGTRGRVTVVAATGTPPPTETEISAAVGGVNSNVVTVERDN